MSPLRRVFGERAGPRALGILVPPGRRTVLILRPRALAWDLLLTRGGSEDGVPGPFREMGRDEAEAAVAPLGRALEEWAGGGPGRVEAVRLPGEEGHCVRVEIGAYPFIACLRQPGQPYRPLVFAGREKAVEAAGALAAVLCPAAGSVQELYFNTRNFSR